MAKEHTLHWQKGKLWRKKKVAERLYVEECYRFAEKCAYEKASRIHSHHDLAQHDMYTSSKMDTFLTTLTNSTSSLTYLQTFLHVYKSTVVLSVEYDEKKKTWVANLNDKKKEWRGS